MIGATWVMAIFTILVAYFTYRLVEATKGYTTVTKELLKQSEETFRQSQKAFENDLFGKIVFSVLQLAVQQKRASQKDLSDLPLGMLQIIKKTDYGCYERIKETVEESWKDQGVGTVAYIRNAIKKIEEKEKGRETDIPKPKEESE